MTLDPAISAAIAVFLAGLLGMAAWHKLGEATEFEQALAGYGLVPPFAIAPARLVLGFFELAAVALLLLPLTVQLGAALAAGLLTIYALVMARALASGRAGISCGCHLGSEDSELSWRMIWRNAGLVLIALALMVPASRMGVMSDYLNGAATGLCALILYHAAGVIQANRILIRKFAKGGA